MREYKVVAVAQIWNNSRLERKATEKLNSHAEEGWQLAHVRWGLNSFAAATLYMVLEREKASQADQPSACVSLAGMARGAAPG